MPPWTHFLFGSSDSCSDDRQLGAGICQLSLPTVQGAVLPVVTGSILLISPSHLVTVVVVAGLQVSTTLALIVLVLVAREVGRRWATEIRHGRQEAARRRKRLP